MSALAAALVGLGMPKDRAIKYEADVKADRFLVIVHGSADDIAQARHSCGHDVAGLSSGGGFVLRVAIVAVMRLGRVSNTAKPVR